MIQWGTPFEGIVTDSSENMIENFFSTILKYPSPCVWYAHFAQYDWRYFMDYIIEQELEVNIGMRTDNDVYEITITNAEGNKVVMRDSYAMWPSKLEALAKSFCPEIPKLEFDFESIKFDPTNPEHVKYARRDVQILLTGLPRLNQKIHEHFGVNINATTASTALKAWQKTLKEGEYYDASQLDEREIFIRSAYYGGIVFLTNTKRHADCETFDINSSYPFAMCRYGVPYGRESLSTDYCEAVPGIYTVTVRAPANLKVPILPARNSKGHMRWFSGEFKTTVTNHELIFAAQHGYEILKVHEGIVWEKTVYPFNPLIEKCKSMRAEFVEWDETGKRIDLPEAILAKLMQNSLYGKFGSRRERRKMMAAHMMTEEDYEGAIPYDTDGHWYVKRDPDDTGRTLPAWAVFITAHARLRLLQAAYSVGVENVVYGDTDSITVRAGASNNKIDIGNEYGQFKLEKEWKEFRAIAPKVYSGILQDGKRKGAAKGLPKKNLTDQHWKDLLEDGKTQASVLSLNSLRVTLKNGVKPAVLLMRNSSTLNNSQNYENLQDGEISLKMYA